MPEPPQSLHLLGSRFSHFLRPPCGALTLCLCCPLSLPTAASPCPAALSACCSSCAMPPSSRASRHSRHLRRCFPCSHRPLPPPPPLCPPPPKPASTPPAPRAPVRSPRSPGPACSVLAVPAMPAAAGCAHCGHCAPARPLSAQAGWKGPQAHCAQRRAGAPRRASPHTGQQARERAGGAAAGPVAGAWRARVYIERLVFANGLPVTLERRFRCQGEGADQATPGSLPSSDIYTTAPAWLQLSGNYDAREHAGACVHRSLVSDPATCLAFASRRRSAMSVAYQGIDLRLVCCG